MNWYNYYFERLKETNEYFTGRDLYMSLCIGLSNASFATIQDLKDLTRAYNDYMEGFNHETVRINRAI